jgi:hypothetical protein
MGEGEGGGDLGDYFTASGDEGEGDKYFAGIYRFFTLTFTLWSIEIYSTGQALSRRGRGDILTFYVIIKIADRFIRADGGSRCSS